jgi:hypothetical protein
VGEWSVDDDDDVVPGDVRHLPCDVIPYSVCIFVLGKSFQRWEHWVECWW